MRQPGATGYPLVWVGVNRIVVFGQFPLLGVG